jgi:hypothetical protein
MIRKIMALVISNGIVGLEDLFKYNNDLDYTFYETTKDFNPPLHDFDILIIPNGSDHIALHKIKDEVLTYLNNGGILFCFDGWFTNWIPGNRWIMDNSKKTIDVRYSIRDDQYNWSSKINIQHLNFSNGISGWWACGYIQNQPKAQIFIEDNWQRPLVVIDEVTTNGTIVLTASGPCGDFGYSDDKSYNAPIELYHCFIELAKEKLHSKITSKQESHA